MPNVIVRYDVWADSPSHAIEKLHVATQKAREAERRRYLPMWYVRCAYKLKSQSRPFNIAEYPYGYRYVGLKYAYLHIELCSLYLLTWVDASSGDLRTA